MTTATAPPAGAEAFTFTGSNFKELALPDDAHQQLTIELWAKRGARDTGIVLFHSGSSNRQYPGVYATGELQWVAGGGARYPNGVKTSLTAAEALPQDTWVHLAFVKNASANQMIVYVNGVEKANVQGGTDREAHDAPTGIGVFRLGHSLPTLENGWSESWMVNHGFEGQIAELRIWNVARSQEEIVAGMGLPTAYLPGKDRLLLYGPAGGEMSVPNFPVGPPAGAETVSFTGNNFTEVALSSDAQQGVTVEFWAKRGLRDVGIVLFHSGNNRQYPGVYATGELQWVAGGGARYPQGIKANMLPAVSLPRDTWVHLAFVKDVPAGRMAVYQNGVEKANVAGPYTAATAIGIFRLAHTLPTLANGWSESWMKTHGFEGQMAEVRIWKVARTPAQILAAMNVPTTALSDRTGLMARGPVTGQLVAQ